MEIQVEAKADPKKPYKMYAAIIAAFLTSFLTTSADTLPAWAVGLITAVVAGIGVYITGNPINVKKSQVVKGSDNPTLFD